MSLAASLEPGWIAMVLAVSLDLAFGEPPSRFHPVVWMGKLISVLERLAPSEGALRQLAFGAFIAALVPATFAAASFFALETIGPESIAGLVLGALLLKTTFSLRLLGEAVYAMREALGGGDLAAAQNGLGALCSRDPSHLAGPALVAATIESAAENASDSIVAPLFYYSILGLPGAMLYRAVNTLDSMVGYHGRYEYLGKTAARLDDLLNIVPARLTALLLIAAAPLVRKPARRGMRILLRDGAKTESPNAGRPMAAMAGLLGVELEKEGHYRLGDAIEPLRPEKIDEAWAVVKIAAAIAVALYSAVIVARHACRAL